jgi:lipocalin
VRFEYLGKKVYALTSSKGEVRLYLIADGIELDRYIGKWLEIAGTVTYPKEFAGDGLLTGTRIDTVK